MGNKSLKKNAVLNTIRQISTVIFPLITFPYISRVLQTENYGKVSFSQSIVNYFSLLAALGITNYAIREGAGIRDDQKKIEHFSNEIFTINIITMLISYCLLFVLLLVSAKIRAYSALIGIQSFSLLFATIGVDWIYNIYEDYFYITCRSVIVQLISIALMFAFVKTVDDFVIYSAITVFSAGGANIFNFFYSKKYVHLRIVAHPNIKSHIGPMLLLFCNTLMITIYVNSDTTILGFIKDDAAVGIYTVATKIYIIVKNLLNAVIFVAIPRVSYYRMVGLYDKYKQLLNTILNALLTILLPAIVGLFMESKNIILIISGEKYVAASSSLRILCIALAFSVLACYIVNLKLLPSKRDKKILLATCASAIINLLLNFIFIPIFSYDGAAITTAIAELVVVLVALYYSRDIAKVTVKWNNIISIFLGCIAIIVVCVICHYIKINIFIKEIITVFTAVISYIIVLAICKNDIMVDSYRMLKKMIKKRK